ncbi:MAG TPA: peptidoglycan DD-metalloendopeptidase family protein [Solirubrobacterales bacterium]|nr:peptidoglycan DD-metalloendopeptidase family protein [Solirubrobacterales bacterium]
MARGAWLVVLAVTIALTAILASPAAIASASTGGAPTPSGSPPPPPSQSGSPDPAPSDGALSLVSAKTWPRKSFYYGVSNPRLRYEIGSDQATNDLRIDLVADSGEVMKSFYRNDVAPGTPDSVRWDGTTGEGRPAPSGHYSFRIVPQAGGQLPRRASSSASSASLSLSFDLYGYAFPILGAHDYGGAAGRFGAARSGHTHEGQDVMAKCGTPLIAARGGRVQYSGYQGAAGNYIVIDGKGTSFDMAYMHLLEPSPLQEGMTVRTGEPIGVVGQTGDATACHLHFEIWTAPGWYEGGSPIDPLPYLQEWDSYS